MDLPRDHFRRSHKIFLITVFELYVKVKFKKSFWYYIKTRLLLGMNLMQIEYGYLTNIFFFLVRQIS